MQRASMCELQNNILSPRLLTVQTSLLVANIYAYHSCVIRSNYAGHFSELKCDLDLIIRNDK